MRHQLTLRAGSALVAAGVLSSAILVPGAPAPAQAQDRNPAGVQVSIRDGSLRYGEAIVLTGRVGSRVSGAPVALQFRPAGATAFRTIARASTAKGGAFRLAAGLRRSGAVRVMAEGAQARALAAGGQAPTQGAASNERRVRVAAHVATRSVRRHVLAGHTAKVAGTLRPARAGRTVALQVRRGGAWSTVDRHRTDGTGRYALALNARRTGSLPARVRFAGDGANAAGLRTLGAISVYRRALASWYGPGLYGNHLGCGGRLSPGTIGVAHKTLPCGTRLTLRVRGRSLRVSVIDRGPYVGAREFDLTAATKQRLGFGSTGTVWTTR